MHYVYVLISQKDSGWYIGYTKNIQQRLRGHNYGRVRSTKPRRPLTLIYTEEFSKEKEAKKAERYYKSGACRAKLKSIINKNSL